MPCCHDIGRAWDGKITYTNQTERHALYYAKSGINAGNSSKQKTKVRIKSSKTSCLSNFHGHPKLNRHYGSLKLTKTYTDTQIHMQTHYF